MATGQAHCERTRDAELYVVGELSPLDLDDFARHLQTCDACAQEVELLETAAEALPLLTNRHVSHEPLEPAPSKLSPVLQQQVKKLEKRKGVTDPITGITSPPPPAPSYRSQLRVILGGKSSNLKQPFASEAGERNGGGGNPRRRAVPRPAMIGILLVAIIAAATVIISGRAASIQYDRDVKAGWSPGGAAIKFEGNSAEVLVENMTPPAHGTGYQVWVLPKGGRLVPTPAWLSVDVDGDGGVAVPGDFHDWEAIAVYVEPLHGRVSTKSGAVIVADIRKYSG